MIVPGDVPELDGRVPDAAAERPHLVEGAREGDDAVAGDASVGGLHADHAAQRGRLADGRGALGSR